MQSDLSSGFRLSPQQEELWLSQREDPARRAVLAVRIEGALDVDALTRAIREVACRHEILRTVYRRRPGMKLPFQVVLDEPAIDVRRIDLGGDAARIDAIIAEESARVIDPERGPVLHAAIAAIREGDHALVLGLPALSADAPSLGILLDEIRHFYATERGAAADPIEAEPLQYADFAEFQHEHLAADDAEAKAGRDHWAQQDLGPAPAISIPFERTPSPGAPFSPASVPVALAAGTSADDAALIAGFTALLARVSGKGEVVVNVVTDGRHHADTAGAIGLFSRALPLRVTVDEAAPLRAFVEEIRSAVEAATKWQDRAPRGAEDRLAIFERTASVAARDAAGVTFAPIHAHSHAARFGVKLSVAAGDGGTSAALHYDASRFQREDMLRLADSLATALAGASGDAARTVGEIALVSPAERRRLTEELYRTAASFPEGKCIHELFEDQAARTPDRPALAFADQRLTYAELNARTNQLAHHLRKHGVGRDSAVGLLVDRSAEMIVGLLGILKAGGAYVPLLPDAPRARLAHQLAEIEAKVVVTQERLLGALPEHAAHLVCLDRDLARLGEESREDPPRVNQPSDLAYVIYTSGSTGTPKGVAVKHENLTNYTHFLCNKLELGSGSGLHFATVSTIAADLGNTCIFPSLVSGGCLHVIDQETGMDADRFAAYAKKHPIDVLKITPSHLGALLSSAEGKHVLPRRFLITGGEASSWALVQRIREMNGDLVWINHYGPTETTIGSLTFDLRKSDEIRAFSATVPIGKPIANTRAYILDARREPVPFGAPGELYIAGRGVTRGYLERPDETADRFVRDPFSAEPEARMYRTGDRVRHLPDGSIEFLGRVDFQVKIRGYRVELGEIEAQIRKHPEVGDALVLAREDTPGDLRLVAYVVPNKRPPPATADLRSFLSRELPEYMIPSAFVALEALPLTPNGKVDRKALPVPELAQALGAVFVAPEGQLAKGVADIWSRLLKIDRVSMADNFFDLGGHSLLATQVMAEINRTFAVKLSVRTLFEAADLAALVSVLAPLVPEEMLEMMAEIEGLSADELQALLEAERGDG